MPDLTLFHWYQCQSWAEGSSHGGPPNFDAEITSGGKHTVFDRVIPAESAGGDIEFRKIYIRNESSEDWLVRLWISQQTPFADDEIAVALAVSDDDTQLEAQNYTYVQPLSYSESALEFTLAAGGWQGIWLRRTVTATSERMRDNSFEISVGDDTAAKTLLAYYDVLNINLDLVSWFRCSDYGEITHGGSIDLNAQIIDGRDENVFDDVSVQELIAGDVEYRKIFVRNGDTDDWPQLRLFFAKNTIFTGDTIACALGTDTDTLTEAQNYSYTEPADYSSGLAFDLPAGSAQAIWLRRTVTAGETGLRANYFQLRVSDTVNNEDLWSFYDVVGIRRYKVKQPLVAVTDGIFELLRNSAEFNELSRGLFFYRAPEGARFPFVTLWYPSSRPWTAFTYRGETVFIQLDVWDHGRPGERALKVAEVIMRLLDDEQFAIDFVSEEGELFRYITAFRRTLYTPLWEEDSKIFHIALRYKTTLFLEKLS